MAYCSNTVQIEETAVTVETALFEDLLRSMKEAGEIAKGNFAVARRFHVGAPDGKAAREQTGLSASHDMVMKSLRS